MCSMSLMWPAGEADPRARGPGELVAHAGVGGVVHGPAEFPTTTRLGATSPQSRGHSVHDWLSLRSRSEEHTSELQSRFDLVCRRLRARLFPYTTLFRSNVFYVTDVAGGRG